MKSFRRVVPLMVAFALAPAAKARAETLPNVCTCVMTIVGGGEHEERQCDGFNSATHARCSCEKVDVQGQTACEPKGQTTAAAAKMQSGSGKATR